MLDQSSGFMATDSQPAKTPMFPVPFPAASTTLAPADAASGTPHPRTLDRETILLVEDEDAVRVIVSTVLRRHGYQVLEASSPRRARDLFEQHASEIDLLLTDVVMPEMNGRVLAELLVALRPELRILFISGYSDMATPLDEQNPNVGFLSKPFQASVLAAHVREMLSRPARGPNDA